VELAFLLVTMQGDIRGVDVEDQFLRRAPMVSMFTIFAGESRFFVQGG